MGLEKAFAMARDERSRAAAAYVAEDALDAYKAAEAELATFPADRLVLWRIQMVHRQKGIALCG